MLRAMTLMTLLLAAPTALGQADELRVAQSGPDYGDVIDVFEANGCISCHRGANPAGWLDLRPHVAWQNMVGQRSTQARALSIVAPGRPMDSYLYLKLIDRHLQRGGSGVVMPIGRGMLSPDELAVVRDWIASGAER